MMSLIDRFRTAWSAKFPSDSVPYLPCLGGDPTSVASVGGAIGSDGTQIYGTVYGDVDVPAIERSLQECNSSIERLHRKIAHKQFIADFLWTTLHDIGDDRVGSCEFLAPALSDPSLKNAKKKKSSKQRPVISRSASLQLNEKTSEEVFGDNDTLDNPVPLSDLPTPTDNVDKHINDCSSDSNGISGAPPSEMDAKLRPNKKKRDPQAKRKNSLPLLDQEYDANDAEPNEDRCASLDSKLSSADSSSSLSRFMSTASQHQKPVPTPRISVQPKLQTTPMNTFKNDTAISDNVAMQSATGGLEVSELESRLLRGQSKLSTAPKPPPKILLESSEENKKGGSVRDRAKAFGASPIKMMGFDPASNKEPITSGKQRITKRNDYEEATPFRRDTPDSDDGVISSDDEEPLYYNMMLLKEQMLSRAQTWYGKTVKPPTSQKAKSSDSPVDSSTQMNPTASQLLKAQDAAKSRSSESIRSIDSDTAFEESHAIAAAAAWRNSLYHSTDSTENQNDELDSPAVIQCPDNGMLQMRKWVVSSVFESERAYLSILDILMQYMQTFRNLQGTAQMVLAAADIDVIFFGVGELHMAHKFFVHELEPVIANWSAEQQIAAIFKKLTIAENQIAADYLKNYQKAVVTIHRCWQENETFMRLTKEIQVKGMKEKPSLEELLHKPVVRFQRNTLVLHDLVKSTPTSHADYDLLQKTLGSAQNFIENFDGASSKENSETQRYLAKQGLIVEKVGNIRKLRHIFLFNDLLVCARQKFSTKQRINFEPKWQIPLVDLSLDDKVDVDEERQMADNQQQEIEQLQRKVSELQGELKTELKQSKNLDAESHRQWSFHNRSKNMEKIKKKLMEQQAAMIKASPRLLFRVHNRRNNRLYTLLMASDYERANWRTCIAGLLSRAQTNPSLPAADLVNLLNTQKLPKGGALGSLVDDIGLEEELLFGCLNIKIFKLQGLKQAADAYCTVEVDSFSHFFIKAKTRVSANSLEPVWNEDFDIDLEGAQTVRLLCYKVNRDVGTVIGTCALELSKAWLRGDFLEKAITLSDETSLVISLRYSSREQTMKRSVSCAKGGVFGVKIRNVAKREGTNIPLLIAACIEEIEHRGIQEVGIYRISGVTGEIKKLKMAFERNSRAGAQLVKDAEVHVVTGLLKLYFRELPEALFTDALYPSLVTGMGLADPEAKEKYFLSQLQQIPEPNHSTVVYVIDHLIRVAQNESENKMSLQNLATVFGPTLLRPAVKGTETQTMEELFSSGTRDAMLQTTMLMTFFNLRQKGITI